MIEHHIQRDIIDRLARAEALRFSELKPGGMESNIFMYHLKQLIKDGYVEKIGGAYHLTSQGMRYVDGLSQGKQPSKQPKLIAIIALRGPSGRWLLAERKIQPYIGKRMFLSGKQHFGETSLEHAARELAEKTGWSDIPLTYRGLTDIQISDQGGGLLTHVVAQVYVGQVSNEATPPETSRFRYIWHDFSKDKATLMPGTAELLSYLTSLGSFNISLRV